MIAAYLISIVIDSKGVNCHANYIPLEVSLHDESDMSSGSFRHADMDSF
jgi:hypothetical protein